MASKSPQNTNPEEKTGDGKESPSKKKMTPDEQSAQFIKTARELKCDESPKSFGDALKKILPK